MKENPFTLSAALKNVLNVFKKQQVSQIESALEQMNAILEEK